MPAYLNALIQQIVKCSKEQSLKIEQRIGSDYNTFDFSECSKPELKKLIRWVHIEILVDEMKPKNEDEWSALFLKNFETIYQKNLTRSDTQF